MLLLLLLLPLALAHSIDDFGAVRDINSAEAARANSAALEAAVAAADASATDNVALIPQATYYIMEANMTGITDVHIQLQGKLVMLQNRTAWGTSPAWHRLRFPSSSSSSSSSSSRPLHCTDARRAAL